MTPFRRSRAINLLITGSVVAALTGCGSSSDSEDDAAAEQLVQEDIVAPESWNGGDVVRVNPSTVSTNQVYYNNTYAHGLGYYHALAGRWFPLPYGYNRPGSGYFSNGSWGESKPSQTIQPSRPLSAVAQPLTRPGEPSDEHGTSRGGFGSSSHFSGVG